MVIEGCTDVTIESGSISGADVGIRIDSSEGTKIGGMEFKDVKKAIEIRSPRPSKPKK